MLLVKFSICFIDLKIKVKEGAEKAKGELEKAKKELEEKMQDDFSDKG